MGNCEWLSQSTVSALSPNLASSRGDFDAQSCCLSSRSPPACAGRAAGWLPKPELNISILTSRRSSLRETFGRYGSRRHGSRNVRTAIAGFGNQFAKQEFSDSLWIKWSTASKAGDTKDEGLQWDLENKAFPAAPVTGKYIEGKSLLPSSLSPIRKIC